MDMENMAAMEVLKEIKSLMDSKLGDKLSAPSGDEKGIEISKVKLLGDEGSSENPEMEMSEPKEEMGMDPMEMEELKKIRANMMG